MLELLAVCQKPISLSVGKRRCYERGAPVMICHVEKSVIKLRWLDEEAMDLSVEFALMINQLNVSVNKKLVVFNAQRSTQLTDSMVSNVVSCNSSQLHTIRLWECSQITDESIQHIVQNCGDLQKLSLYDLRGITLGFAGMNWCTIPNLKHLDLRNCKGITDTTLLSIGLGCLKLTWLDVAFCVEITDVGAYGVVMGCRGLTTFRADCCVNLTDELLMALIDRGTVMSRLDLYGCDLITSEAMSAAEFRCLVPAGWVNNEENDHMADLQDVP